MMTPVDHSHGYEAAISDEADPLYEPLGGLDEWAAVTVDEAAWAGAVDRFAKACLDRPAWAAMVDRGMRLATAHQSGALDGLYPVDGDLVLALLRGDARLESIDETIRPHVRANVDALDLACEVDVNEDSIRRIHEVACRPQVHHHVLVEDRVQDHVLAAGDYKHHPNHRRDAHGHWHPTVPVALIETEMAALVERAGSPEFAAMHPAVQAAWLHRAVLHIQPFADGNGRVARALAGARLLRAISVPFLPMAGGDAGSPAEAVEVMERAVGSLIDVVTAAPAGKALERWMAEEAVAAELRGQLVPALTEALGRYAGGRAALTAAYVVPGDAVVVRVPPAVDETITADAHRDGPVLLTAVEAGLRLEAGEPLDPWLDRVVSTLALRVAAELE
jgi:hypothetical protein